MTSSTGKNPHVAPVSGLMFPSVARSASASEPTPGPKYSTSFPTTPVAPQDLRHRQHEIGRGRALRQPAGEPEADDLRHEHRQRLAEHRRLRLDAADAPAEHAEPVHHRRVRVGADERVRERGSVARLDDAREVLEVHLVADARVRRDDAEVVERALPPAEERVALAVPLELALDVVLDREPRRELVHLHRVVDDELRRDERIDLRRIAALLAHRVAHRGEVDDRGHAGEVLEEHARRHERDLARRLVRGHPARDGLDLGLGAVAEHVLEQDPQRVREPRHVPPLLERVEPVDLVAAASDRERGTRAEGIRHDSDSSRRPA